MRLVSFKNAFFAVAMLATSYTYAQKLPQPSPAATTIQTVGLTEFTVKYSRPGVKGRKIFGDLVPMDKVWRTGANLNTIVEFNTDVEIEGTKVSAGKYSLFIIPHNGDWEVILNNRTNMWGAGDLDESKNVTKFKVTTKTGEFTETMRISFENVKDESADLVLTWENVIVPISVKVDAKKASLENIENALAEAKNVFRTYHNSAKYYLDNNMDAAQALTWSKKSVEITEKFWNVKLLSEAYAANGDYKMAITTAEKSLEMSKEAKYDPYIKANEANIAKWKKMK